MSAASRRLLLMPLARHAAERQTSGVLIERGFRSNVRPQEAQPQVLVDHGGRRLGANNPASCGSATAPHQPSDPAGLRRRSRRASCPLR